jgi:hypothetical protein
MSTIRRNSSAVKALSRMLCSSRNLTLLTRFSFSALLGRWDKPLTHNLTAYAPVCLAPMSHPPSLCHADIRVQRHQEYRTTSGASAMGEMWHTTGLPRLIWCVSGTPSQPLTRGFEWRRRCSDRRHRVFNGEVRGSMLPSKERAARHGCGIGASPTCRAVCRAR